MRTYIVTNSGRYSQPARYAAYLLDSARSRVVRVRVDPSATCQSWWVENRWVRKVFGAENDFSFFRKMLFILILVKSITNSRNVIKM